jgi:hypothetical protein
MSPCSWLVEINPVTEEASCLDVLEDAALAEKETPEGRTRYPVALLSVLFHREQLGAQAIFHLLKETAGDARRLLGVSCVEGAQSVFLVHEAVLNRLKQALAIDVGPHQIQRIKRRHKAFQRLFQKPVS